MRIVLACLVLASSTPVRSLAQSNGAPIVYLIRILQPASKTFEVEMSIPTGVASRAPPGGERRRPPHLFARPPRP